MQIIGGNPFYDCHMTQAHVLYNLSQDGSKQNVVGNTASYIMLHYDATRRILAIGSGTSVY